MSRSQVSTDSTLPKFRLQCTVLLVEFLTWPLEKLPLPVTLLIWNGVWTILMSWVVRHTRCLESWRLLAGGMQLCMSSIVVNRKGQFWKAFRSSSLRPPLWSEIWWLVCSFSPSREHQRRIRFKMMGKHCEWNWEVRNQSSDKQGQQGSCDRSDINAKLVHSHVFTRLHAYLTPESTCCTPHRPIGL